MNNDVFKEYTVDKRLIFILGLTFVCLLPFLNKPFHLDDPIYLWTAEFILKSPTDFHKFPVNWYGVEMPLYVADFNPPGVPLIIAFVASLFGWSEPVLHAAFLLSALALSSGVYFLARQMNIRANHLVASILVLTPAFIVSSSSVMTDITMTVFYLWAIIFWTTGIKKNNNRYLFIASLFIICAIFSKYFGMTLIPLLFVYALRKDRRISMKMLFFLIPLLTILAYECYTYLIYGKGLISGAGSFAIHTEGKKNIEFLQKFIVGLSFAGGGFITSFFFFPLLWSKQMLLAAFFLIGILFATVAKINVFADVVSVGSKEMRWLFLFQATLYIAAGVHILALALNDFMRNRGSAESLMLLCWIMGAFIFSVYVNWTTNVRTMLPMLPAVAVLVVRRLEWMEGKRLESYRFSLLVLFLVPAAVISFLVAWADYSYATVQKNAARDVYDRYKNNPSKVWFQGHWGFQYYMEKQGYSAVDFDRTILRKGDVLIFPVNNTSVKWMQGYRFYVDGKYRETSSSFVATNNAFVGAGFYGDRFGPLPFVFGRIPPERFHYYRVIDVLQFAERESAANIPGNR